ncbi:MAG: GNAT family N-acetyltransferase [Sphingomonadaceae bacterium]|nr:GNAT family N-acetyltransferase [Sphingomonadaceae bacterium]
MTISILDDHAAVARLSCAAVGALTEAAIGATFYRDDLSDTEVAANRRIPKMARELYATAAVNPDQAFSAAFVDGVFAGFAISTRHGPGDHELDWLMVHPEHHGGGVAAALTERAIAWLGADRPMWLNVLRHNARAISFYRRFGFEIDPDAKTGHVIPHWIMRRPGQAAP